MTKTKRKRCRCMIHLFLFAFRRQPVTLIKGFFFLVFNFLAPTPSPHSLPQRKEKEASKGHDAVPLFFFFLSRTFVFSYLI